jgi:hypothetical protein
VNPAFETKAAYLKNTFATFALLAIQNLAENQAQYLDPKRNDDIAGKGHIDNEISQDRFCFTRKNPGSSQNSPYQKQQLKFPLQIP